jgi:hypothetical protein
MMIIRDTPSKQIRLQRKKWYNKQEAGKESFKNAETKLHKANK